MIYGSVEMHACTSLLVPQTILRSRVGARERGSSLFLSYGPSANLMNYNNPYFSHFSISSEILIHFGLTLFTVLTGSDDNRENEVPSSFRKAYNLIAKNRKRRQSDKP